MGDTMVASRSFTVLCSALLAFVQPVSAAEQTLNFRLVTRDISEAVHTNENIEGLRLSAVQAVGVAVFDDGRLAYKEYVNLSYEGENAPAKQPGFSSYVFQNGDSLQVSFEYGPGEGGYFVDYTILSGTGAYAGATGTGRIAYVDSAWDDATLFEGSFTVTTP